MKERKPPNTAEYEVLHANTDQLKKFTVPYIQRLMNEEERKKTYLVSSSIFTKKIKQTTFFMKN